MGITDFSQLSLEERYGLLTEKTGQLLYSIVQAYLILPSPSSRGESWGWEFHTYYYQITMLALEIGRILGYDLDKELRKENSYMLFEPLPISSNSPNLYDESKRKK